MVRTTMRALVAAMALTWLGTLCPTTARADHPDIFYNYYAWPSCTGLGAELYVSPRPVPPHVGHTYITYQPLMPHEFMYHHHRSYYKYNRYGGHTIARVHYH